MKLYKSYMFKDKDPVIDALRTLVQQQKVKTSKLSNDSGVSTTTIYNWFDGPTQRPSHAAVAAVASVLGYRFVLQAKSQGGKLMRIRRNG